MRFGVWCLAISAAFGVSAEKVVGQTTTTRPAVNPPAAQPRPAMDPVKAAAVKAVEGKAEDAWGMALDVWKWAEPGYQETKSSARLADYLEKSGFRVRRGAADIPTAFIAEFGQGKPIIGILAEYDALPGLAQEAVPERKPREGNGYGHACGHHLFGAASVAAAAAAAELIQQGKLKGTVRLYGCPAEEGGAAKVFMVRAGLFNDCDAVLHWHPSSRNSAGDATCLARIAVKFRFHGASAHASGSPEYGRSAVDAVQLTAHASELLREHTPDFTRIHHVITSAGAAPNVVPDFAEIFFYIRHPRSDVVKQLYPRLVKCAEAGALATETKLEIEYLGGTKEIFPNATLGRLQLANLQLLNDLQYTAEEQAFAARIQNTLAQPRGLETLREVRDGSGDLGKGSTDVGDVSWITPTSGFSTVCWAPGTSAHSWQATAAGGTTLGRKGMMLAARVLAASACDLFQRPELIAQAKAEHAQRLGERKYESLLLTDQKPPFNYRNLPSRAPTE